MLRGAWGSLAHICSWEGGEWDLPKGRGSYWHRTQAAWHRCMCCLRRWCWSRQDSKVHHVLACKGMGELHIIK